MKKSLKLTKALNFVSASFNYELERPKYNKAIAFQFAESEKQKLSNLFQSSVYLKFGKSEIQERADEICLAFVAEISNINIECVNETLKDLFPVILIRG